MGLFQVNSYILVCERTRELVVVDPGDEPHILLARLEKLGAPRAILNTHGHLDHVAGNAAIKARYDVPIHIHPGDHFLLESFDEQARLFGLSLPPPAPPDENLVPGREFRFGDCTLEVLHTPGHSPGSVTFRHGRDAVSGDVLFAGSVGRTDLPGGNLPELLRSIDEVLVPLGDSTRIHPGHGPSTTIGEERSRNPFLREKLRRELLGEPF
jgi:glyoxylase-like metal-dependent hydrolase (beta-lactamase superfamily II)